MTGQGVYQWIVIRVVTSIIFIPPFWSGDAAAFGWNHQLLTLFVKENQQQRAYTNPHRTLLYLYA